MFDAAPASAQDCEKGATNMSQVRACLYYANQRQVDAAYHQTLATVRAVDPHAASLLAAAEKSWEKFASDSCDYTAAVEREAISEDARVNCFADFAAARIRILQAYRRAYLDGHAR
jgi:uncharacterized protein YecT (DUF1311 family)